MPPFGMMCPATSWLQAPVLLPVTNGGRPSFLRSPKRNIFLLILSPDALQSKWVLDEINVAWRLRHEIGTRIIPIKFRSYDSDAPPAVTEYLKLLHYVDFAVPKSYDVAFSEVVASIAKLPLSAH